jgi:Zn-dependent protease
MGRLTLNPIAHIDPIGTILVPLFLHVGWAKPVPVNFAVLSRTQMLLVSIAGPASNLLLAIVLAFVYHILPVQAIPLVETFILASVFLNIALAIFNLLPIPPLDGSRIIYAGLKSPKAIMVFHQFSHFGIFIVLGLAYFGGFSLVIEPLIGFFFNLLRMPSL